MQKILLKDTEKSLFDLAERGSFSQSFFKIQSSS